MLPFGVVSIAPVNAENGKHTKKLYLKTDTVLLWVKVALACVPSAVVGLLFDDLLSEYFGSPYVVAVMLIVYGVAFILVEKMLVHRTCKCDSLENITFLQAFLIGLFQVLSLIPGTSRSGATIIGALLIGVGRTVGAEFTFFLAVPTMLGASVLKLFKYGFALSGAEIAAILIGLAVAYLVSLAAIRFLMDFVKKHSFTAFGCYRIVLGALVLLITLV
jgi:undecaprenyl-diphosphatase